ncbi:MAG: hypothetical protein OEY33_05100, partial [Bdellovibrionales bacterium]|nr:hypothetical protein [Bdellovibrionales bacterium]
VADRFFYLPSLGFSLILAFLFVDYKLNENKKFLTAFTIYLFLCTALSLVQIGYWKEPKYIIAKNLQVTPDSYALNISYGTIMKNEENYRKAAYHYSVALRLKPEMEEPRANLEMLLKKINRPDLIEKLKIQNFILDIKKELSKAF